MSFEFDTLTCEFIERGCEEPIVLRTRPGEKDQLRIVYGRRCHLITGGPPAEIIGEDNNGVFHGYGRCEVQNDQAQEQERASSHAQQGGSKMEPLSKSRESR